MSLVMSGGVAALLFVTTNVDDIFVLVTFFADPAFSGRQVVIGQFLGIGALVALSLAGSLLALVMPPEYLGLLGLVPFALGVFKLVQLVRRAKDEDEDAPANRHGVIAVALVTIANGGDNIGAYVPVFATRTALELAITVAVFFVMTAVWCFIGHTLVNHPRVGPLVKRFAKPITPIVLMAIGVLIVVESGAYRLVTG